MNIIEQALGKAWRGAGTAADPFRKVAVYVPIKEERTVRCPNHRGGGATRCPRGGAALQIWQRQQWGE